MLKKWTKLALTRHYTVLHINKHSYTLDAHIVRLYNQKLEYGNAHVHALTRFFFI